MQLAELKDRFELLDYITDKGKNVKKVGQNTYRVNPCPVCGHEDHFTIYTETNSYSSFSSCCKGGSVIDYFMEVEDMSKAEAIDKLKKLSDDDCLPMERTAELDNTITNKREEIAELVKKTQQNTCDYYRKRGFSEDTIVKYRLGYLPDGCKYGKDYQYVLPVSDNYLILRSANNDKKSKYINLGNPEIFNVDYLEHSSLTGKQLFITEGIFDALSLEELNFPAVAINSTTMTEKLIKTMEENKDQLKDKLFVLALDNDQSGRDASKKLKEALYGLDLSYADLNLTDYKDVNEFFVEDPELLKEMIEYIGLAGTTYEYLLNEFKDDQVKRFNEPDIKTGFKQLDNILGGGMYPGFYVLGSISSLGKTALALQMADKIAEQGQSVLFFSLEMGRYEMTCRSLTRVLYEQEHDQDITTGHILKTSYQYKDMYSEGAFKKAQETYMEKTAKNLSLIEGNFDIDANKLRIMVKEYTGRTGKKPVVFVDYLQVLKPSEARMTDKQHIDQTVVELKRISRDLDLPVVAISSFNRSSYNNDATFEAFKESGSIEYTADVVFGLQFRKNKDDDDINQLKNREPRPLDLVILKNRRGKAYEKIELNYYAKQNYFVETF